MKEGITIIQIQEITKQNWFDCTQLTITQENGKSFIVPIVYSLAESKFEEHLKPVAIYNQDELVGFSMYCQDPDDLRFWIYVFMIDEKHQGKGYGKQGLCKLLEWIRREHDCNEIIIGYKPDNFKAEYLYISAGFRKTGNIINGETIMKYEFIS